MPLVAVSGSPGTGTTTLCRLLAPALNLPHVYAGQIFRDLAKERGMSLADFGKYAEEHPEVDRELDQRMIRRVKQGNAVVEGRMAAWQVKEAGAPGLKVLLTAPEDVRAARVAEREHADLDAILEQNRAREASERKRYLEYYDFDPGEVTHYDLVIDTAGKTPEEIRDLVLEALERVSA